MGSTGSMDTTAQGRHNTQPLPRDPGLIDAHAHHNNGATCPLPLLYSQIREATFGIAGATNWNRAAVELIIGVRFPRGVNVQRVSTVQLARFLVELNNKMMEQEESAITYDEYKELVNIQKKIKDLLNASPQEQGKPKWRQDLNELEEQEKAFHKKKEALKQSIPSLIIVPTMDMELAHLDGYNGQFIYQEDGDKVFYKKRVSVTKSQPLGEQTNIDISHERIKQVNTDNTVQEESDVLEEEMNIIDEENSLKFQNWRQQVEDTECAAASNPLRLLPLFFYDPRRYRYGYTDKFKTDNRLWDFPFKNIVADFKDENAKNTSKIWFGFKMYPSLGYKPLDELCPYLPLFYKKCEKEKIPILTHCAPGGMTTHEAMFYKKYNEQDLIRQERAINGSKMWKEMFNMQPSDRQSKMKRPAAINPLSNIFVGNDIIYRDGDMDYFCKTYGHPENWRMVLDNFPDLHLCLAHFGGDGEWERFNKSSPPKGEYIQGIVDLTKYKNVYTDVSCLNIYNKKVKSALTQMLMLAKSDTDGFKHLKNKLIFGSDWYLIHLTEIVPLARNIEYTNYCNKFKQLFYEVDRSGEFWRRVSLINPWKCYSLSTQKLDNMLKALPNIKDTSFELDVAKETFEKLEALFNEHIEEKL